MNYETISIRLGRAVTHKRYVTSRPEVELTARLSPGEELGDVYQEVLEDAAIIMNEMEALEIEEYKTREKGRKQQLANGGQP